MENALDIKKIDLIEQEEAQEIQFPYNLIVNSASKSTLIDEDGKEYIDFSANIDNNSFGFDNELLQNVINENLNVPSYLSKNVQGSATNVFKQQIINLTGHSEVYISESTNDAKDTTLQIITAWAKQNDHKDEVLVVNTFGHTQSIDLYKILIKENNYNKFIAVDLKFINKSIANVSALKNFFSKRVAAVIFDTSGVLNDSFVIDHEILDTARMLCDKNSALLVFNSSKTSPGRMGKILPVAKVDSDVTLLGAGLAQGMSLGVTSVSEKVYEAIKGNYKHLYGTSVIACCLANKCIETMETPQFFERMNNSSEYMLKSLQRLHDKYMNILDIKVKGLYFIIEMDFNLNEFVQRCFNDGLIFDVIDSRFIKLTPPYIITNDEIDHLYNTFEKHLSELKPDYVME